MALLLLIAVLALLLRGPVAPEREPTPSPGPPESVAPSGVPRSAPTGRVFGRVVDEITGAPLPRAALRVESSARTSDGRGRTAPYVSLEADASGKFEFTSILSTPRDGYDLHVTANDYCPSLVTFDLVPTDVSADLHDIKLRRAGKVRGRLTGPGTEGFHVELVDESQIEPGMAGRASLKGAGVYEITEVPEGRYRVVFSVQDAVPDFYAPGTRKRAEATIVTVRFKTTATVDCTRPPDPQ